MNKICSILYDREEMFKSALEQERKNKASQHVRFVLTRKVISWNKLYDKDMSSGKGFLLDTSVDYNQISDENYMIESNSIMSYKFGIRSNDPKTVQAKRFRCACGNIEGPCAGVRCPICDTETTNRYAIRGWWTLNKYKIFNPDWFSMFITNLRTKARAQVMSNLYSNNKDRDGFNILDLQNKETLIQFVNYYMQDDNVKEFFLANIDCAMSDKIPCISKDYRYYSVVNRMGSKPSVNNHPLNKLYFIINNSVRDLNRMTNRESAATVCRHLSRINNNLLEVYEQNKYTLGGTKESYIRGKVAGRRKRSSGRMVVEALLHPRLDVCTLPYAYFGEFFLDYHRDLFIKHGLTAESENRMRGNYPTTEDKLIMIKVLADLKKNHTNTLFAYRAPALYKGSMVSLEILGLTNSNVFKINDTTLDAALHGDKDGDILGVYVLPPSIRQTLFFAFNPKRLTHDFISGKYNGSVALVESYNYLMYEVLNDQEDHSNDIVSEDEMKRLGLI